MEDQLMTTKQVAIFLGVSTSAVLSWAKRGTLACSRLGARTFRFQRSDVLRMADVKEGAEGGR